MARRGARTHVELVEYDAVDDGIDGTRTLPGRTGDVTVEGRRTDAPDGSAPSPRSRRRALTAAVAVLVALGAVATVGQVREAARERDRLATVASLRSALAPLDDPPAVLWRAGAEEVLRASARTPDGLLVGTRNDEERSSTARALDPATGEAVWERELLAASDAAPDPEEGTRGGYCLEHGRDPELLACFASDARYVLEGSTVSYVAPTVTRLLLLDPRDGTVVADLSDAVAGTGSTPSFVVVGDLAVVGSVVDETAHVVAVAPDGEVAWRTTVPAAPAPASSSLQHGPFAEVIGLGEHVLVATPTELLLLDRTGATVRRHRLGRDEMLTGVVGTTALTRTGPDHRTLTRVGDEVVSAGEGTRIVRADRVVDVTGTWQRTEVDDGSADGLLLTVEQGGLHGWDLDGTRRWTADLPLPIGSVHVLAGRVHVADGGELVTLDARTGVELWRRGGLVADEPPLTDGRRLLVRAVDPDGARRAELLAVDAADGAVAWRTELPPGIDALQAVFGTLMGITYGEDEDGWSVTALG